MKSQIYLALSASIFVAVALGHLVRLIFDWPVTIGPFEIPMWLSFFGVLAPGILSAWGFSQVRRP